ncbi:MAG: N-acetylmuramoyl-L-alanine amidase family protein [Gorillibacterium sp.]|nr:N-acetylmuramoyl-L-alanine amidase family protein [Gorillibacterium sp.]
MKKYRILLFFALFFFLIPQYGHAAAAEENIKIMLDGQSLQIPANVKVENVNNSIMVPLRMVVESLGFEVKWNQQTQLITVFKDNRQVELTIGSMVAQVDGVEKKLPVAPVNRAGTSLVPLRFVSETMGLNVGWDNQQRVVSIKTPSVEAITIPNTKLATIDTISFSDNRLLLAITGSVKPDSLVMANPDRIVVNLPYTQFSSTFGNGQSSDTALKGELQVIGDPTIEKIRYSLFTTNPATVRVVIDLKEATPYVLSTSGDASSGVVMISFNGVDPLPPVTEPDQTEVTQPDGSVDGTVPGSTDGTVPPIPGGTDSTKPPGTSGKKLVVIDAGHGDHDPGAIGVKGKQEKDFNLAMVLKVEALLKLENIDVILTRNDDTFVTLANRAKIANDLHADAFVSIHANTAPNSTVGGTETYYYHDSSKTLANVIHANLVTATGFKDRKVKYGDLAVLRETVMPATLLEVGFLSNELEEATLFNEEWQVRVAKGIVAGIKQYFAQMQLNESVGTK